jgi:hypothetical protein
LPILITTSTAIINTIIIRQIAHTAVKVNTAEYREADLKIIYADSNENTQADTKINYDRKNVMCMGNLNTSQLDILAINDNRHLINSAEPLEKYLIES